MKRILVPRIKNIISLSNPEVIELLQKYPNGYFKGDDYDEVDVYYCYEEYETDKEYNARLKRTNVAKQRELKKKERKEAKEKEDLKKLISKYGIPEII